jgi:hypothetical protein
MQLLRCCLYKRTSLIFDNFFLRRAVWRSKVGQTNFGFVPLRQWKSRIAMETYSEKKTVFSLFFKNFSLQIIKDQTCSLLLLYGSWCRVDGLIVFTQMPVRRKTLFSPGDIISSPIFITTVEHSHEDTCPFISSYNFLFSRLSRDSLRSSEHRSLVVRIYI